MSKKLSVSPSESETMTIRRIENGYVTDRSYYTKDGYECKSTYSKEKPTVTMDPAPKTKTRTKSASPLSGAMKVLRLLPLLCLASTAMAQSVVHTQPIPTQSTDASGTIAVTDTFQSVFAAVPLTSQRGRTGCLLQNNSAAATMWVFFGPIASATKGKSVVLAAKGTVTCERVGGSVLFDQVSITGTSSDAFTASQY